jgi:hypothetical protein
VVVSGQLEDEGLVRIDQSAGRKVAHLTDEGRAYVQKHRDELVTPWETATRTTARSFLSYATSLDRCRWSLCRWRKQAPTARSSRLVGYCPVFGANSTGYSPKTIPTAVIGSLEVMHVVAWAASVGLLTTLAREEESA